MNIVAHYVVVKAEAKPRTAVAVIKKEVVAIWAANGHLKGDKAQKADHSCGIASLI